MKKKLIPIFLLFFCVLSYSCHKDKYVVPDNFYLNANKTGIAWAAQAQLNAFQGDSLVLTGFKPDGEEHILLKFKFTGVGLYPLTGSSANFNTTIGLDVILSNYNLYSDPGNSLSITNYDQANQIVTGQFNVVFKSIYNYNNAYPDKITFTNGAFRLKIQYK